jgi:hypothetical protein
VTLLHFTSSGSDRPELRGIFPIDIPGAPNPLGLGRSQLAYKALLATIKAEALDFFANNLVPEIVFGIPVSLRAFELIDELAQLVFVNN